MTRGREGSKISKNGWRHLWTAPHYKFSKNRSKFEKSTFQDLEKHKNGTWAASRRNSLESINSTNSNRRGIMGCEDELDTSIEPGGAGIYLFWIMHPTTYVGCVIQKRKTWYGWVSSLFLHFCQLIVYCFSRKRLKMIKKWWVLYSYKRSFRNCVYWF